MAQLTINVADEVAARLRALVHPATGCETVEQVVETLVDHAQQGVYRPGAWERPWLEQAFGYEWQSNLEPDTDPGRLSADGGVIFDRPMRKYGP